MSDTPRTDAHIHSSATPMEDLNFARQLERELNEAKKQVAAANKGAKTNAHVNQDLAKRSVNFAQERDEWRKCAEDNDRWMRDVLTDFRIPFDDHLIGRRLALAQWMADKLKDQTK